MSMFYSEGFTAEEDLQRQKRNHEEKYRTDKESDDVGMKKKITGAPDKSGRSHDED